MLLVVIPLLLLKLDKEMPRRLKRALWLVWRAAPGWTLASSGLMFLLGFLPLVSLYLMKWIVDAVAGAATSPDPSAALPDVFLFIGLAGLAALVTSLVRLAANLCSEIQALIVTDDQFDLLHAKSLEVDLEFYENSRYHDTLHRAQREAAFRPPRIVGGFVRAGQAFVALVAMSGLLVSFHWFLVLALFAATAPGILIRIRYSGKIYRWVRSRTAVDRKAWYIHWLLTHQEHAKELRLFQLGPVLRSRFKRLRQQLRKERIDLRTRWAIAELLSRATGVIAMFATAAWIAKSTLSGATTIGDLVIFFQAFQKAQGFLNDLLGAMANLYEDSLYLGDLYEFFDVEPKVLTVSKPLQVPKLIQDAIEFRDVGFSYPDSSREVLKGVNLRIEPGQIVALVGENGAGKTTLIKLLCRLYDPDQGQITIDGMEIRQFPLVQLRRLFSVVFQDYVRYHLTARENIWFGDVQLEHDDPRIIAAARESGAHNVISSLPDGYETILGKWFEGGEELSIGQWQKVALARAFVREAPIVVLDEPTSHLDAHAEEELFQSFRQLVQGRMAVLISHRLSTVKMADRIYVLENSTITESGPHDDLMRLGGTYAKMFEKQAMPYR